MNKEHNPDGLPGSAADGARRPGDGGADPSSCFAHAVGAGSGGLRELLFGSEAPAADPAGDRMRRPVWRSWTSMRIRSLRWRRRNSCARVFFTRSGSWLFRPPPILTCCCAPCAPGTVNFWPSRSTTMNSWRRSPGSTIAGRRPRPVRRNSGKILSFFGAKGGVGTTTLAVHLAMFLVRGFGEESAAHRQSCAVRTCGRSISEWMAATITSTTWCRM